MIKTKIENEKEIKTKNKEVLINLSLLNEYKKAVDVSAIVSKTDSKGIITFANEKFCKISGYSRKELLGAKHNLVKHPDTKEDIYKELWKTILSKKVWKGVLKNRAKDGSAYYVKSTIVPIVDVNGEINEFIAIRYDITDLINKERRIKLQTTDALTGLPNRQKLLEDLHFDENLILAIFNIQRFRQINEFYGFEIGDKFLIEVSKKLNELVLKEKLSFYKLQGDEYAILSSNKECTLDYFKTICKKIVSIVKEYSFEIENYTLNADFCIGISSEKNYFINAEMAKNHAKLENKEIIVFDENREIKNNLIENINWTKKLKSAIENDRIVVFKQPIISNKNNKIEKYECLVRLMDEEGTIFSPFYFLHVAKKAKLYNRLTQIIIKKSFSYFSDKDVEFSVNLTIEDILNKQTVELIEQSLNKYKTISQRVIFEIVEEEGIENYDEISFFIEKIKSYGCKIAIDDFGTGYSNFEYLMKLNVDIIKIDGSMIKYINQDLNAKIVTELIVTFSKKLKIKTVAEYVHSKEVYEIIKNMGIDYSQGFYFGKPESID
ncbi:GGDEF domain-containing phosphodiesterase [Arcobacter sp. CECT 8985]|uniref:bifunctional diguanylate cyclase/phosphodiesterase n=1 Tax=Arcobacter sp. CECT 8985 TaxID=1935424 RepID=UPI00100B870C|nr:GGDEF domain-containing phosphodiesterase [Arcobacter sp. CECT 8985]RXJ83875.1 diguanylate cyclase [Arcobacter sp. CECT 8985]